jgi:hypothetical protein
VEQKEIKVFGYRDQLVLGNKGNKEVKDVLDNCNPLKEERKLGRMLTGRGSSQGWW